MGNYNLALECFIITITLDPKLTEGWENFGELLLCREDYRGALGCFDKLIELESRHEKAWFLKGIALFNLHKFRAALFSFQKVLQINVQDAFFALGKALVSDETELRS